MTADEIFEEVRTRLNELQVNTVDRPWTYQLDQLVPHARSAMRGLRAKNIVLRPTMNAEGVLSAEISDTLGVLIAAMTASRVVKGDLLQKLREGELGVVFKTGADSIDTTTAARALQSGADEMDMDVEALIAVALASLDQTENGDGAYQYGGQLPYPG